MIRHKTTYTCHFVDTQTDTPCANRDEALRMAAAHVGNWSYTKPFPREETYLFGPGDGTTSVLVRQDFDFADEPLAE
jgi:hypothetical protein